MVDEKKEYWLHRISHEWELAYPLLLEQNYLSIGWSTLADEAVTNILQNLPKSGPEREREFRKLTEEREITSRSRWNLWYFFQMKPDDIVLVPMFSGDYAIFKVVESAKLIRSLDGLTMIDELDVKIVFDEEGPKIRETGEKVDLGFVIKVECIKDRNHRSLVQAPLVSRMKIRFATANISDLKDEVEAAIIATKPPNLHANLQELITKESLPLFYKGITPDQFEGLVKSYLIQMGADRVRIPAKNETGKDVGTDADVIAEFDDLKINIYVQAKKHIGKTSSQAVQQILNYGKTMIDESNEINHILWAVSTAEFNDIAIAEAQDKVRLIGGSEFMNMLLNAGLQEMKSWVGK